MRVTGAAYWAHATCVNRGVRRSEREPSRLHARASLSAARSAQSGCNCLVHHSDLTAHGLSDRIGCRYDRLIAYAAVNGTDEMPLRHLIALTRETGRSFALEAEAHECGFLLIPQQAHAFASDDPMREVLGRVRRDRAPARARIARGGGPRSRETYATSSAAPGDCKPKWPSLSTPRRRRPRIR